MRKRFIEILERRHTETMRKDSQFQSAEDENEAYEMWRERRKREPKRRKDEPQQHRMSCPACAARARGLQPDAFHAATRHVQGSILSCC